MLLLLLFISATTTALFCGIHFPRPLNSQLVAVEQTIPFQLSSFSTWCGAISATEYTVDFSDFDPGFEISAYLVGTTALKTEHITIPSSKYPYIDEPIEPDEQRYLLPINYYADPPYLLGGSIVSLRLKIDMPESVDALSYAVVNIFISRDEAVKYEQGKLSTKSQFDFINVTECAKSVCTNNYTIVEDSFYFFVFSSKADSDFLITANFTFEVFRYVDPSTLPSALNVANISKNFSGSIPFHPSKTVLLYVNPPNVSAYERLAHVNFTCLPRYELQVPVYMVVFILEGAGLVLYGCCFWGKRCRRNRQRTIDTESPSETNPLIN